MSEERGVVKYLARDGQEVTLSFQNVKQYLVSGNKEAVTNQELMYFLGVCKSRGLNPFKKDAYLIKYGSDPAAIITSIDYFRSRAKAQPDCVGWKKGIIIQNGDGTLKDSAGIILEGEKLVGGFFEAQPEGWKTPFRLEVNLGGYIKKTREGKTTRFWEADNQPTMISKVAEGQGLRTLWPDEFQGIYEESEIKAPTIDMSQVKNGSFEKAEPVDTSKFDELVNKNIINDADLPLIEKFVTMSAKALSKTTDEVKLMAIENFPDFLNQFNGWVKKNGAEEKKNIINNLEKGDHQTHKAWFDPNNPANAGMKTEESAAPGEQQPGKEPETPKTEDVISGAEAKTTTQGPQPSAWDPYNSEIQQRYPADKAAIIKAECEIRRIMITGLVPREAHGLLLDSVKAEMEEMKADTEQEEENQTTYEVEEPETEQAAAHKKMLDEKEAKRKEMYGDREPGDEWSEDDPQKMADDPKPDAIRADCIRTLQNVADIDRTIWMKTKQQVGIMTTPRLENMPIDKLVEWATLARATVERITWRHI